MLVLLATVMTTTTAWADAVTKSVKYIGDDEYGNFGEMDSPDNTTVINSEYKPTNLSEGWYVVEGTVNYTDGITLDGENINIILSDGAELNVGTKETPISGGAIMESGSAGDVILTIYAQGGNSGKLKAFGSDYGISVPDYLFIGGGNVTGIGGYYGINVNGGIHIFNATVEGTGVNQGICAGNLSATAATLKAKADIEAAIWSEEDITLDGCDVTAELKTGSDDYGAIKANLNLIINNNVRTVVKASTVTAPDFAYGIGCYYGSTRIDLGGVYDIQVPAGKPLIGNLKTCSRTFTSSTPSTIVLPFSVNAGNFNGGKFYEFTGVHYDASTQQWVADMVEVTGNTEANKPYVFVPAATALTFTGPNSEIYATSCTPTVSGDWTFKGTYSTIEWTSAPPTPTYGFSAQDANDGITQGQFVKVGSYVRIKPMRAYLEYNGTDSQFINARSLTRAAATTSDDTLPETIGVRLISANGEVNAIGTISTRTGEVTMDNDAWYSLDGRRIVGKPSTKGVYINNGNKVVIK